MLRRRLLIAVVLLSAAVECRSTDEHCTFSETKRQSFFFDIEAGTPSGSSIVSTTVEPPNARLSIANIRSNNLKVSRVADTRRRRSPPAARLWRLVSRVAAHRRRPLLDCRRTRCHFAAIPVYTQRVAPLLDGSVQQPRLSTHHLACAQPKRVSARLRRRALFDFRAAGWRRWRRGAADTRYCRTRESAPF